MRSQRREKGALFLVADGMGGHRAGQVASRAAVERVKEAYYADTSPGVGDSLERAIKVANLEVYERAQADPALAGMGTTLVAAVLQGKGPQATIANVGDSRAYLLRRKRLTQISVDHSWVEAQFRAGLLTREQAQKHPQRNLITRALGIRPTVEVDIFERKLRKGDALLLCTDGVSGELSDKQMAEILQAQPPGAAAAELVAQASTLGGKDNATAMVVQAEPGTGLFGRPRVAADQAGGREHRALAAGMVILLFLCLIASLAAAVLVAQGKVGSAPQAAPQPHPVHYDSLGEEALAQVASSLGYNDVAAMEAQEGNEVNQREAELWPARRGIFLVGRAQRCRERSGGCDFQLRMGTETFLVSLEEQDATTEFPGKRVWVFGYQEGPRGSVVAQQIDFLEPLWTQWPPTWAWWNPSWERGYQAQEVGRSEPVWVYATAGGYPDTPLHTKAHPELQRGEPILAHGRWVSADGARPMMLSEEKIYRLDQGRYVPVESKGRATSQPTVTLQPTAEP